MCAFVSPSLREAFTPLKHRILSSKRIFIRADLSRICIRLVAYCLKQPTQLKHIHSNSARSSHPSSISIDIDLLVFSFMNAQLFLRLLFYECTIIFPFCSLLFYEYQYLIVPATFIMRYTSFLFMVARTYSIVHITISQLNSHGLSANLHI